MKRLSVRVNNIMYKNKMCVCITEKCHSWHSNDRNSSNSRKYHHVSLKSFVHQYETATFYGLMLIFYPIFAYFQLQSKRGSNNIDLGVHSNFWKFKSPSHRPYTFVKIPMYFECSLVCIWLVDNTYLKMHCNFHQCIW